MSTLFEQLNEAEAQVTSLTSRIRRCGHDFDVSAPIPTTVRVEAYDFWAGPGYASEQRHAIRQTRTCRVCGLHQESVAMNVGETDHWLPEV